ncbi:MAG: hypothetical protein IKQ35_06140 [Bacilli bacterium]|nr:hypothetical protein [Bacilli bacterium]
MKKLRILIIMLMLLPMTTFAYTTQNNGKIYRVPGKTPITAKGGSECNQTVETFVDYPVVGEKPATKAKMIYTTSVGKKTIDNITIVWKEMNDSYYNKFLELYSNPDDFFDYIDNLPDMTTETFQKDKYYYWDFDRNSLTEEQENLIEEAENEITCGPLYIYNGEKTYDSELSDALFYSIKPLEKDNTVSITNAAFIHGSPDLYAIYDDFRDIQGKVNGLNINLDLKFKTLNGFYVYQVTLRNGTDEDHEINVGDFAKKSDYIDYKFEFADGSNVIKAMSYKTLYITATYKNEVPENVLGEGYTEANEIELKIGKDEPLPEEANNPKTGVSTAIVVIGIGTAIVISIVRFGIKRKIKYFIIVLATVIVFVPFTANAIKQLTIKVSTNVEIINKIQFKLDGKTYYALPEMTWEEWMNSKYNTDHYVITDYKECEDRTAEDYNKRYLIYPKINNPSYPIIVGIHDDIILENQSYTTAEFEACEEG